MHCNFGEICYYYCFYNYYYHDECCIVFRCYQSMVFPLIFSSHSLSSVTDHSSLMLIMQPVVSHSSVSQHVFLHTSYMLTFQPSCLWLYWIFSVCFAFTHGLDWSLQYLLSLTICSQQVLSILLNLTDLTSVKWKCGKANKKIVLQGFNVGFIFLLFHTIFCSVFFYLCLLTSNWFHYLWRLCCSFKSSLCNQIQSMLCVV